MANPYHDQAGRFTSGGSGALSNQNPKANAAMQQSRSTWEETSFPLSHNDEFHLEEYTGTSYVPVNQVLRGEPPTDSAETKGETEAHIMALDHTIREQYPTESPSVLYRGMSGQMSDQVTAMKPGDTYRDPGFPSTTTEPRGGLMFAGSGGSVMEIHAPEGSQGLHVDSTAQDKGEGEVILPRGSSFEVLAQRPAMGERPPMTLVALKS